MTEQPYQPPQPPQGAQNPFEQPAQAPAPTQPAPAAAAVAATLDLPSGVLDLDAARKRRAAAREGRREALPIRIGGQQIAVLPVEMPLDVLEPLRRLDTDIALVLRQTMQAVRSTDPAAQRDAGELVIDLLAANPDLPITALTTIRDVAVNLLTEPGFRALMSTRPSTEDLAELAKGVLAFYGVTLGESSRPSASQEPSGGTSSTTSGPTSASTPATSTPTPGPSDTSGFAAS